MNIVDVLIGGLILLGALQGYHKGLITGLAQFAGSIIGLIVAILEYPKVLEWLEHVTPIQKWVETLIYKLIEPAIMAQVGTMSQQDTNSIFNLLPPGFRSSFIGSIPGLQSTTSITQRNLEQVIHALAAFLTEKILPLLSFALIFMGIVILIQVIASIVLAPLGILGGSFNRGGGVLFGGISAFLGLVVTAGVVSPMLKITTQSTSLLLIQHSLFLPYLIHAFQIISQLASLKLGIDFQEPFNLLKALGL